jgi:signal transduction histidine kinase
VVGIIQYFSVCLINITSVYCMHAHTCFWLTFSRWDTFFLKYLPSYAEGISIILSDGISEVAYSFVKDEDTGATRVNCDPEYTPSSENKWSWVTFELDTMGSSSYSITVHFERTFAEDYRTHTPIYVMCISLLVTLVTSLVFVLYDRFMCRAAHEQDIINLARREFVRYVSHEIRTPMNTLHIGATILFDEISEFLSALMKPGFTPDAEALMKSSRDWLSLVSDMGECSDEAILVLNDIINYDKVQMDTVQLDKEVLDTWSLLNKALSPFALQAKKKDIDMDVDLRAIALNGDDNREADDNDNASTAVVLFPNTFEVDDASRTDQLRPKSALLLHGDRVKLAQVVRNVVSNALKFTPSGGRVSIKGDMIRCPNCVHCWWMLCYVSGFANLYIMSVIVLHESSDMSHKVPKGSLDERLQQSGCVTLSVKDSGAGMSEENLKVGCDACVVK